MSTRSPTSLALQLEEEATPEALETPLKSSFFEALTLTLPVFLALFPVGIALGLVASELGVPWFYTLALSMFAFAGSSEFLAVAMLARGEPLTSVALTVFLVNFRHVFYGISVYRKIPAGGFLRCYTIAALCDETYALIAALGEGNSRRSVMIAALNHVYWFGSVGCGLALANLTPLRLVGIEFCLPALFIVLTIEQWHNLKNYRPFLVALPASLVALVIAPKHVLLLSIVLSLVGLMAYYRKAPKQA